MTEVRLRDVAQAAGVHVATASRALNPATRGRVNAATAARVQEAAERLGYEVNFAARALRTQRSMMIGVLIPDIARPLYPPVMRGIGDVLEGAGYTALLAATDEDEERERRLFHSLRGRGVDGFILATAHVHHPLIREAAELGIPTVAINRTAGDAPVSSVAADNTAGMVDLVTHLVALGHQRIAHIAGPADTSTGRERTAAFHEALRRLGRDDDPDLEVEARTYSIAAGVRAARELFAGGRPFSAIATGNDLLSLGVFDVLRENRLRCPDDVSVTGFSDLPMMDRISPTLTTVRVPQYEMGAAAARCLLEVVGDPTAAPRHVVLPVELVVRGSTGLPRGDAPSR